MNGNRVLQGHFGLGILTAGLLSLALASAAEAVTLVSDDRIVSNNAGATATPSTPFEMWAGAVSLANQQSTVGTQMMSGAGGASTFSDIDSQFGSTLFDVTFDVTSPTQARLSGEFNVVDEAFLSGLGHARVDDDTGTAVLGQTLFPLDGITPFDFMGVLDPGRYRLRVSSAPNGNGSMGFDFSFVVPEPGTGLLTSLGLLVLAAQRRRGGAGAGARYSR